MINASEAKDKSFSANEKLQQDLQKQQKVELEFQRLKIDDAITKAAEEGRESVTLINFTPLDEILGELKELGYRGRIFRDVRGNDFSIDWG